MAKKTTVADKSRQNKLRLVEAMHKSLGIVTQACAAVGVHRDTYYEYYKKDAEFKRQIDDIQNVALDFVEGQLFKQINKGEVSSTIFYLKTKGKNRGFVERSEVEVAEVKSFKVGFGRKED
jgi:hypothetical protein